MTEARLAGINNDAGGTVTGAASLIRTLVWSIVVSVLPAAGLFALRVGLRPLPAPPLGGQESNALGV
jgi:hypothetical protein